MGTMTISHVTIQATAEDLPEKARKLQMLECLDFREGKTISPLHFTTHIPSIPRGKKTRKGKTDRKGRGEKE